MLLYKSEHAQTDNGLEKVTEEIVLKIAREAKRLTNAESLCLAGGVALNCVANGMLLKAGIFKNVEVGTLTSLEDELYGPAPMFSTAIM